MVASEKSNHNHNQHFQGFDATAYEKETGLNCKKVGKGRRKKRMVGSTKVYEEGTEYQKEAEFMREIFTPKLSINLHKL